MCCYLVSVVPSATVERSFHHGVVVIIKGNFQQGIRIEDVARSSVFKYTRLLIKQSQEAPTWILLSELARSSKSNMPKCWSLYRHELLCQPFVLSPSITQKEKTTVRFFQSLTKYPPHHISSRYTKQLTKRIKLSIDIAYDENSCAALKSERGDSIGQTFQLFFFLYV